MKSLEMKDCLGDVLVPGDRVVIVAPSAPMNHRFLHMVGKVVKRRGRKVGICFPESDYVKHNKYVFPDSIMKKSTWIARRKAPKR